MRQKECHECLIIVVLIQILLSPEASSSCGSSGRGTLWREDGRCGSNFPMPSVSAAQCDPLSDRPCCSDYGYCGNSASHCLCTSCVDYRNVINSNNNDPGCYYRMEGDSGQLTSPNYPNSYPSTQDCCYDIIRPDDSYCGVRIVVEFLDVGRSEEEGFCRRDWLTLPSCVPERGARICGNQTGQTYEYAFQPSATAMRFVFHAGNILDNRKGFKINYELQRECIGPYQTQQLPVTSIPGTVSVPCYTRITDVRGSINTPYFPKPYPEKLDCVYEFVRPTNSFCGVRMTSVSFEVEPPLQTLFGGACSDFLHLPSCGFLCGKADFTWVVHFQPGATSLKFHFHSDEKNGHPGFLVNFEQVTSCP